MMGKVVANNVNVPPSCEECDLFKQLTDARSRIQVLEGIETEHVQVEENLHLHQEELRTQNEELREADKALVEAGRRFQDLFDFAPVAYFLLDQNGAIKEANFTACRILDEKRSALMHRPLRFYMPFNERAAFDLFLINAAASQQAGTLELSLCDKNHRCIPVQLTLAVDRINDLLHYRLAAVDMSERRKAESHRNLAATMFEESNEGVIITDAKGRIQRVNRAFTVVTGYTENEVLGKTSSILSSGRHDASFYQEMWQQLASVGGWKGEVWNRRKNGEIYPEWLKITSVLGVDGETNQFVGIFSDIGDRKRSGIDIERFAFYDTLTDLPNRSMFVERLKHALIRSHRDNQPVVLLYLDLDRFKSINDTLGHQTGDLLLQQVAARLRDLVRAHDTVARLGGDEFTVVLTDMENHAAAVETALRVAGIILDQLSRPFYVGGREVVTGSSIGIAVHPQDGETYSDLVKHADIAMYHAKQSGGNCHAFFSAEMNARVVRRVSLESALRQALRRNELRLVYQPVVDAFNKRVVGIEALMRWNGPEGPVSPLEFIPILEDLGLGHDVVRWVVSTASSELQSWAFPGADNIWLSVNISPQQLHRLSTSWVMEALNGAGMSPNRLVIEITEDHFRHQSDSILESLREFRNLGAHVALDDFGTGHSSLGRLRHFPIDIIKIDKSFVDGLPNDSKDLAIVNTIITMARHLDMEFLAEGVENQGQLDLLKAQGCNLIQGYYFAKPMPGDACSQWCQAFGQE
jgi:diguanylate cyclase (GGDEF)-like protein/PAS domain S-box-containing protein